MSTNYPADAEGELISGYYIIMAVEYGHIPRTIDELLPLDEGIALPDKEKTSPSLSPGKFFI